MSRRFDEPTVPDGGTTRLFGALEAARGSPLPLQKWLNAASAKQLPPMQRIKLSESET